MTTIKSFSSYRTWKLSNQSKLWSDGCGEAKFIGHFRSIENTLNLNCWWDKEKYIKKCLYSVSYKITFQLKVNNFPVCSLDAVFRLKDKLLNYIYLHLSLRFLVTGKFSKKMIETNRFNKYFENVGKQLLLQRGKISVKRIFSKIRLFWHHLIHLFFATNSTSVRLSLTRSGLIKTTIYWLRLWIMFEKKTIYWKNYKIFNIKQNFLRGLNKQFYFW